jgi:predicted RNA binding protein YcfA (HicA-like mRNA interferase family)
VGQKNLPVASGADHVKAFMRAGWAIARTQGSHIILVKPGIAAILSIPDHPGKTLSRQLLQGQIRLAGLSERQYLEHFAGRSKAPKDGT